MRERVANEIIDAFNNKGNAVKKREELIKWLMQIEHFHTLGGKFNDKISFTYKI